MTTTNSDIALVNQDYFDIFRLRNSDQQVDALDQAILKHETFVQILKLRRNALIPISTLLPELLCQIFDFAIERSTGNVPSSLVAVTHVCRSWRDVAIGCSILWTDLAITSIPWTDEMLRRSGMASLTIRTSMFQFLTRAEDLSSRFRNLQVALTDMARIKELSIQSFPACCSRAQLLLADLPVSAPLLESLTISMSGILSTSAQDRCKLPPEALSHVDRLRHLQLSRCDVDWESPLFSQLTHLSVEDVSDDSRPSASQLLTILQRLPGLQELALQTCLPINGRDVDASCGDESIPLPRLNRLVLSGKLVELEPWLRRVIIPPTSSIKIICNEPETIEITTALLNLLQALRQSLTVYTLKISDGFRRSPMASITFRTAPGPVLHVKPSNRRQPWQSSFLTEICNNLPAGELTCLHIASHTSIDPLLIANTLGRLPCLVSVLVYGRVAEPFIRSLTMVSTNQPPSSSSSPAFPQLRQISLCDVIFTRAIDDGGSISFETLRGCFISRYELGFEIEDVSVYAGSRVSPQDIASLREIVRHVDWDGKDDARSPSECGVSYHWD